MRNDVGSHNTISEGLSALSRTTDTYYTASVDHAAASGVSFAISCGVWNTSFVATVQHSDDDGDADAFIDEVTGAGNDVSLTLTEAGSGNLDVPNPRERYSRVKVVVGGTNVFGVTNVLGPLRCVE